ncbi:MAG: type II toxin-antitoxin system VapC family toxin [Candidatus Syntropharchaeia archaeon]
MKSVIVDTNGMMIPGTLGVDIFSELERLGFVEVIVPRAVLRELETLKKRLKGKEKKAAEIGHMLSERCEIVEMNGKTDDIIVELAKEREAAVFTNDRELKKRLKRENIPIVHLRKKKYLSINHF